jgi:hypothetical protein
VLKVELAHQPEAVRLAIELVPQWVSVSQVSGCLSVRAKTGCLSVPVMLDLWLAESLDWL